jgi:chemotaxis response regulator CheB
MACQSASLPEPKTGELADAKQARSRDSRHMQPDLASAAGGRPAVRVLLVDGHEVFRGACRALLRTEGIDVIADVPAGDEAIRAATALRPDVVIVDVTPADDSGFRIVRRLAGLPDPPVVMLASSADRCQFGSRLDGHRFIAKADIRAEAIAITAQHRGSESSETRIPPGRT